MNIYISAILGVLLLGVIPLIGLFVLVLKKKELEKDIHILVSFAVGALLGNSILHILPEVIESGIEIKLISMLIVIGILSFYSLEQFLKWRHSHEIDHKHTNIGVMSMVGDSAHNFIDGILIASSFIVSEQLGWATVLAVILHEIPQELADFSILLYAKWSIKKILVVNFASSMFALLGLLLGFWINSQFESFSNIVLAMTVGGFIYIACTDLIPDIHHRGGNTLKQRVLQLIAILFGLGIFLVM